MKIKKLIAMISSLSMVLTAVVPAAYAAPYVEGKTPVVEYRFNGDDTREYTLQNGASIVSRDEENGGALRLDANNSQYVKLEDNLTKGLTGDFTISVDIKPVSETWWTRVFDFWEGTAGNSGFKNIFFSNNAWTPKFDAQSAVLISNTQSEEDFFTLDAWNNACIVRSGNTGYLYINGELRAKNDNFNVDLDYVGNSTNNYLGKSAYEDDPYFDGYIDNFCIYDSALSESEIDELSDMVAAPNDYLMYITFDEQGTGTGSFQAQTGGTVTETGAVNYTAGKEGKALSIEEYALSSNYLTLPDGILAGSEAATYSFWLKPESASVPNWPFMTTPESEHLVNWEKYLGMLATTSAYTVERYNNTNQRISSVTSSGMYDDWKYVTVVFADNYTKVYVNGILAASDSKTVDVGALFTADSKTWLGHANWGDGEGFKGMIDEFKLYGRALSEDEVIGLAGAAYEEEITNSLKDFNKLIIDNNFYDTQNNKIFQISGTGTVKINTEVQNKKPQESNVEISAIAYTADGTPVSGSEASNSCSLDVNEQKNVELTVDYSENVSYINVTVTDVTNPEANAIFNAGSIYRSNVVFPDPAPADSAQTTEGAHDPTIFRDPVSGKYFAYSSHNLVYESEDLINWVEHDYTQTITIPPKAKEFIDNNYSNTTANTTYWAPDLMYVEGDEYPYWFYLSVSCGLGGRNSVIDLVKAKSPGLWDGEYEDCGVVLASKENDNYNTNAIDANIYTDTDGKTYFIWGSFWKGIHIAELITDSNNANRGRIEGIDYTSDATILSSSQKFGSRLFSTPSGVQGPEAPFTVYNSDTGYRYMFTSYGWLGTNYNIRVARTNKTFNNIISNKDPHKQLLDYDNNMVGTAYIEQADRSELWGYKISGSFKLGDGIEYLGSGHNSVFQDSDGSWYLVQHCRKVADAVAFLQVKKMLWTEDGWPVISPLTYSGEEEQQIPENMVYGTWDIASVGQTIFADGISDVGNRNSERNVDLPVHSSEIILQPDGNLGDGLGTWTYDNDHTVTVTFAVDGTEENNQYFKAGDVMKLFVLTGYDKDQRESALVMTGIDQNGITQFAKKKGTVVQSTNVSEIIETTPVVIDKSEGGNPIGGFDLDGNIIYGGDPSVLVDGDTVYMYVGHDVSTSNDYVIPEYICYSSKDLKSWNYEGTVFECNRTTVPWASGDVSAWAGQVMKHNGKYYLYYCTWAASGYQGIGVAVSDSPTGPFVNASQTPLIDGQTMTVENKTKWDDIDPTLWIETDADGNERIYMNWGNTMNYTCELNSDMISVKDQNGDNQITAADIITNTINNLDGTYTEAPWLYRQTDSEGKYTGKYYLFFAKDWREQWAYATTDDIMSGQWEYGGLITPPTATSNTSHGGIFDFNGKTYFIYHNGMLPNGSGYRRSACIDELIFNDDGTVAPLTESSIGIKGTASYIGQGSDILYHDNFTNPLADDSYPLSVSVKSGDGTSDRLDAQWEIIQGWADKNNENYVSIQSVNKPGLYITASGTDVVLKAISAAAEEDYKKATFKTVKAIDGSDGVSFESVMRPGYFLTVFYGKLTLSNGNIDKSACSFSISDVPRILDTQITQSGISITTDGCEGRSVIAAAYNKGVLSGISIAPQDSANENIEVEMDLTDCDEVKVFVWNSTSQMIPYDMSCIKLIK